MLQRGRVSVEIKVCPWYLCWLIFFLEIEHKIRYPYFSYFPPAFPLYSFTHEFRIKVPQLHMFRLTSSVITLHVPLVFILSVTLENNVSNVDRCQRFNLIKHINTCIHVYSLRSSPPVPPRSRNTSLPDMRGDRSHHRSVWRTEPRHNSR